MARCVQDGGSFRVQGKATCVRRGWRWPCSS